LRKALIITLLGALIAVPAPPRKAPLPITPAVAGAPNIVFILTDDQRADALGRMPNVQSELVAKGMTFAKYYAVNPLCCPSRSSTLSGQYSHTTGVYFNEGKHGGWQAFRLHEPFTIATSLQLGGYSTALVGKYLNGYDNATHVPLGWTRWVAMLKTVYYGGPLSVDGQEVKTSGTTYMTDKLTDYAVDYIGSVPRAQPLFLYFAPYAPHEPATPPSRYQHSYSNIKPYRPPSYNEADRSDKPEYIKRRPPMSASRQRDTDALRTHMTQAVLPVDDAVRRIVAELQATGRLRNTLIMFASDNGFMFGEHGLPAGKNFPYEESVRIPLVARWDGRIPAGAKDGNHVVANIDLAPTWADLAGVPLLGPDGISMAPIFSGQGQNWRPQILIEHGSHGGLREPAWCQVHSDRYSYTQYSDGEEELYDLQTDPFELHSVADAPGYRPIRDSYHSREEQLCVPRPPGWTVTQAGVSVLP
jgi:N-acetylglucosamine-6-sulfatase